MTVVLKAYHPSGEIDLTAIEEASRLIVQGRLVAIPTETVYGLGAHALDAVAARKIFEAKGRPSFNPLIVHVLNETRARALARVWPENAELLSRAFWPGALSLVVEKVPDVPDEVTGGDPSVALRVPSHPVMRALLEKAGVPIAAPSANRSNAISPTTAEHVLDSLGGRIDAVLDGGPCQIGIESTVVDVRQTPVILRPGGISVTEIESVIGPVSHAQTVRDVGTRPSPGLFSRHYAPDAATQLIDVVELPRVLSTLPSSTRVGVLARNPRNQDDARIVAWETLGDDPASYAHDLYAALHRLEAAGVTHVFIDRVPGSPAWAAVADRIGRAAG